VGDSARGGEAHRAEVPVRHQDTTLMARGDFSTAARPIQSTASKNEHSKTEFGKENSEEKFRGSRLFPRAI